MMRGLSVIAWTLAVVAVATLGWIPGLFIAAAALAGTMRSLARTARELAPTITCGACRSPVPTYGRVRCGACHFTAEGSVFRCAHCQTRFGHTPCPRCGCSVANPSL